MGVVFESLLIILGASLGLITLGLITGFSPVLYVAQVAGAARSDRPRHAMRALILGVLAGTVIPGLVFLFFHPSTLAYFFNAAIGPIIVSSYFHIALGIGFVALGLWTLLTPKKPSTTKKTPTGTRVLFSIGFLKTVLSVSSLLAIFFATRVIITTDGGPITVMILTLIFLSSVITPFAFLYLLWEKSPDIVELRTQDVMRRLEQINSRRLLGFVTVAAGLLIVGSTIIGQLI